jgi:tripartite-type tricarboxylate transporter receptor subunit TctC
MRMIHALLRALGTVTLCAPLVVSAQAWPPGRVMLILPQTAGGPSDVVARLVAPLLSQTWSQPVVVDNRPGGGTLIGGSVVAKSPPDGSMLLVNGNGAWTGRIFVKDPPFEAADLRPVQQLVWSPRVMVVNPSVPARNLKDFIAYARAHPGTLRYGMQPATSFELDYVVFMQKTGIDMAGVPYASVAPATLAVLKNEVQFMFVTPGSVAAQVADGKLAALAVTSLQRFHVLPDVPTARESGIDYEFTTSFGLWAPSRTPDTVVDRIAADARTAVAAPAVAGKLRDIGYEPSEMSTAQYVTQMQAEVKGYVDAAAKIGVKPQ